MGILVAAMAMFGACKKENNHDCFIGTGKEIIEQRSLPPFSKIIIDRTVTVYLVQDTVNYALVTAGENLIEKVKTYLDANGDLVIINDNRCNWVRSFKNAFNVELHFTKLNSVFSTANGDLICSNTLMADTFLLECYNGTEKFDLKLEANYSFLKLHTGSSDLVVSGKVKESYIYSAGLGWVDAAALQTINSQVDLRSQNDCSVWVDQKLVAETRWKGNVYYTGNPAVLEVKNFHTGQVIKK
ncbi:MAG: DUF2807 domain-containing protein [Bacteroidetes bacterium]|nr:DUF2807 domain-containing protein [Bacteroidota bacterium]